MKSRSFVLGVFVIVFMAITTTIASTGWSVNEGLIAYYPFDDNANDASGNGNNGLLNGPTAVQNRFGSAGSALYFDGIDDIITVNDHESLHLNRFTLAAWVKLDIASAGNSIFWKGTVGTDSPGNNYSYGFSILSDGSVNTGFEENNGTNHEAFSDSLDTQWHFILGTYDGSQVSLWIDGVFTDSHITNATPETNANPLIFGKNENYGGDIFRGVLDDVRIYNRALSESEIQTLFAEGGWTGNTISGFILTAVKSGMGNVTVSGGALTWSNNTGTAIYESNTIVTLTPTPDAGFTFAGWSGCDSVSGDVCTVTMNAAKSVVATFAAEGIWTTGASLPTSVGDAASGIIDGKLYLAGGSEGSNILSSLYVYDPQLDKWQARTSMPTPRSGACAAVIDGKLYVVGGGTSSSKYAVLEVYDPVSDTWAAKSSMSVGRSNPGCGVIDGKLYVAGGCLGWSAPVTGALEMYDPATDQWTSKKAMTTPRGLSQVGVVDGLLYVMGGCCGWTSTETELMSKTIEAYNPSTDAWISKTQHVVGSMHVTGVSGGDIFVAAGNETERYNPVSDTWETDRAMPTPRAGAGGGFIAGKLYVAGGFSGATGSSVLEIYQPYGWVADVSHVLSVTRTGSGAGKIESEPTGIDCGTDCSESYTSGTAVALTPTPDAGFTFAGWSGCDSVSGDVCTVTMNAAKSVTATFNDITPPTGTVTINAGAAVVNTPAVTLALSASDAGGVALMQLSNDGETWDTAEAWAATKAWTLPAGDGVRTVYARFADAAGNWSEAVSDTITLDTAAPVVEPSETQGTQPGERIIILAAEEGASIYYTTDGSNPLTGGAALKYSAPLSITAAATISWYAVDAAGNASDVVVRTFIVDDFVMDTPDFIHVVQGDTLLANITVAAFGSFNAPLTFSHAWGESAPANLSVSIPDGATPSLEGESVAIQLLADLSTPAGTFHLNITASGGGISKNAEIEVVVHPLLEASSTALPAGMKGSAYQGAIGTTGGIPPYIFTKTVGSLPDGLALNADGTLTGVPTARGTFDFTVQTADSVGHTISKACSVRIYDPAYRAFVVESESWTVEKSNYPTTSIISSSIYVTLVDDYGTPAEIPQGQSVQLTSSSTSGRFTLDGAIFSTNLYKPMLAAPVSVLEFYYLDSLAGTPTISVSGVTGQASAAWQPASHAMTVAMPDLKDAVLTVSATPNAIYSQGVVVTGTLKDKLSNLPLGYKNVTLQFTAPSGSVGSPCQTQTSSEGAFTYTAGSGIDAAGTWGVQASFEDSEPAAYNGTSASAAFSVAKADTRAVIYVNAGSISSTGQIVVSGKLSSVTVVPVNLAGIPVILEFIEPDGTTIHSVTVYTYDNEGRFTHTWDAGFDSQGIWNIRARFEGTTNFNSIASEASDLIVADSAGYAILVQGDSNGQYRSNYAASLDDIYKRLLGANFRKENIYYLSQEGVIHDSHEGTPITVNGYATRQNLEFAVKNWAADRIGIDGLATLYIVMMDHGAPGAFYMGEETLSPEDLDGWLDALEADIEETLQKNLTTVIVNGSCHSGSFIPALSKPGRIIATSSENNEESVQGPSVQGKVYGEYFVYYLFNYLSQGNNLLDAFRKAAKATHQYRPCCGSNGLAGYGSSRQHPLLDDNGDGEGSWMNVVGQEDGKKSLLNMGLGANPALISITEILPTTTFAPGADTVVAYAKTSDWARTAVSWVEVMKPSYVPPDAEGTGQIVMNLPVIMGTPDSGTQRWNYTIENLTEAGTYRLFYYVMDDNGDVLPPETGVFYVNAEANQPPGTFDLHAPEEGEDISDAMMIFRWGKSVDPDPADSATYTLKIFSDNGGVRGDELKRWEFIPQEFFYFNGATEKRADGSSLFMTGNSYWWEVEAVDDKGASVASAPGRFHVSFTNAVTGIITGIVYSDADFSRIASATITATIGGTLINIPVTDGAYVVSIPPGLLNISGSADGFRNACASDIDVQTGKATMVDLAMTPSVIDPVVCLLTVVKAGAGTGTVASLPSGIDCGNDCAELYASGAYVVLTAAANEGFVFAGWTGCDSVDGTVCAVAMGASRQATAAFNDAASPSGTVLVNQGGALTNSSSVSLHLTCSDATGCTHMQFSNDNLVWSDPESFSGEKAWSLLSGDGQKQVYAKFQDGSGNWSDPATATITLDTTPPAATATPAGGTYGYSPNVLLNANEQATIRYTTDGAEPDDSSSVYTAPIPISADATLRFFAVDMAGNKGEIATEVYHILDVLYGDLNHDGFVNLTDAMMGLQTMTGKLPTGDIAIDGDANGDGRVGLPEIIYILQKTGEFR